MSVKILEGEIQKSASEGLIDANIANQMTDAITDMTSEIELYASHSWQTAADRLHYHAWLQTKEPIEDIPEYASQKDNLQFYLNRLNIVGSGLKSFSGILQTEMQIEIGQ